MKIKNKIDQQTVVAFAFKLWLANQEEHLFEKDKIKQFTGAQTAKSLTIYENLSEILINN